MENCPEDEYEKTPWAPKPKGDAAKPAAEKRALDTDDADESPPKKAKADVADADAKPEDADADADAAAAPSV